MYICTDSITLITVVILTIMQLSFLGLPSVDFSISGFGGLDLVAFPLAYYWVNVTISWVLEQVKQPFKKFFFCFKIVFYVLPMACTM